VGGEKTMTRKKKSKVRWKPGINQFGKPLARALLVTNVPAYQCSQCGTIMLPGDDGKPPLRCSNRKTCGRILYVDEK
jgi:hypothetical protein